MPGWAAIFITAVEAIQNTVAQFWFVYACRVVSTLEVVIGTTLIDKEVDKQHTDYN